MPSCFRVDQHRERRKVAGGINANVKRSTLNFELQTESQAAESRKDFIHKMKLALKELKETFRWLRLAHRVPLIEKPPLLLPLIQETDELIRIFTKSIETAESKQ